MASKLVTFLTDIYPYCKGDVVRLDEDVLTHVDKVAKSRKVKQAYEDHEAAVVDVKQDVIEAETAVKKTVAKAKKAVASETAPEAAPAEPAAPEAAPAVETEVAAPAAK